MAWLFGYVAHIIADLMIHPVISRKFGAYAKSAANWKQHHFRELNQNGYLFNKFCGKEILGTAFLDFSRLGHRAVKGSVSRPVPGLKSLPSLL